MRTPLHSAPELAPFLQWRKGVVAHEHRQQRFEEWLFLNASSVLLSEKTGELLALNLTERDLTRHGAEEELKRLSSMWSIQFSILFERNHHLQLIVYQHDRLEAVLEKAPFCIMVGQLHYRPDLTPEGFIAEIRRRWHLRGDVPHEIGIALGYPLDDVFGYMGLLPLPCKGVCGWRVYGCMRESHRLSSAFNNPQCRALAFLAMTAPGRGRASA